MNKKVAIFYTTGTKTTEATSWKLRDELAANGFEASDPRLIRTADPSDLSSCDLLVLGTPSYLWGTASVSALDFDTLTPPLADPVDLKGKPVAIFGTGDQVGYPQFFADGMGLVWNKMAARGAKLVGQWPTDSYTFEDSKALLDGKFIGMVIDDLNQPEQTDERIQTWVAQLKEEFTEATLRTMTHPRGHGGDLRVDFRESLGRTELYS
eukprot:scaffold674_cov371-Prasinococcus_capsulatus_cf.AAC.15